MATQPYRKQSSLMDLVSGASSQPSMSLPQPTPDVSGGGTLSPEERQGLLAALLAPEDIGPAPEQTNPTQAALGMLFSSLGDATNAFNAGRSQQPGFRSNYAGQALDQINQQKADLQTYNERKAAVARHAKERGYNYLLNEDDKAQSREAARQLKDMGIKQQQDEWKQRGIEAAAREAQDLVQQTNAQNFQREMQANELKARKYSDDLQAGLNRKKKTDEDDKDQHKTVLELRQGVVAAKAQTIADLQAGKVTPEQVEEEWQDSLDASGLIGDYREAADAFYRAKMGPIIMRFAPQQGPSGSPGPQSATDYALGQLGQAAMSGLKTATTPFVNVPKKK